MQLFLWRERRSGREEPDSALGRGGAHPLLFLPDDRGHLPPAGIRSAVLRMKSSASGGSRSRWPRYCGFALHLPFLAPTSSRCSGERGQVAHLPAHFVSRGGSLRSSRKRRKGNRRLPAPDEMTTGAAGFVPEAMLRCTRMVASTKRSAKNGRQKLQIVVREPGGSFATETY